MKFWNRFETSHTVDWKVLSRRKTKGELLEALKAEAARFTSDDLDAMMVNYDAKISDVPKDYRTELSQFARIQITGGYNRLMTKTLDPVHAKIKMPKTLRAFCDAAAVQCSRGTAGDKLRSLKYLIAAFSIFIEDEPPHPVGMPFPGGGMVEYFEGIYYCPVRDAWNEVDDALCSFCPAKQTPDLSKEQRGAAAKTEKLENYWNNYHG